MRHEPVFKARNSAPADDRIVSDPSDQGPRIVRNNGIRQRNMLEVDRIIDTNCLEKWAY